MHDNANNDAMTPRHRIEHRPADAYPWAVLRGDEVTDRTLSYPLADVIRSRRDRWVDSEVFGVPPFVTPDEEAAFRSRYNAP